MSAFFSRIPPFVSRVISNENTRRAFASAVAGVVVGAVSEALWPKPQA